MPAIKIYIDCSAGVSGDMLRRALSGLCTEEQRQTLAEWQSLVHHPEEEHHDHANHGYDHGHAHNHDHAHFHRSFRDLEQALLQSGLPGPVRDLAIRIYRVLGEAEAKVHGESLDTVHFHEVGRPEAFRNLVEIAGAAILLAPAAVECSIIVDGRGTVRCSHGEIPVPVPAVRAMMDSCSLAFDTCDRNTELVTPTGLAALLGIGAIFRPEPPAAGRTLRSAAAPGTRRAGDADGAGEDAALTVLLWEDPDA